MQDNTETKKIDGVGLALSGGGYRATLYHIGSLWRLNELGWFNRLNEITSVSGGSIIAAYLGYRWKDLEFNEKGRAVNFDRVIVEPLRDFCSRTIDVGAIISGLFSPFRLSGGCLMSYYKRLFGNATLQDLPLKNEGPLFTIYATSLQTGVSVRFSQPYMADYRIGMIELPEVKIATAVAASSDFAPLINPIVVKIDPNDWKWFKGADLFDDRELYSNMTLVDGGFYDNMGLERVWDRYTTVLVSDAGAPFPLERCRLIRFRRFFTAQRLLSLVSRQNRAQRKRWLISDFKDKKGSGTYWGITTKIANYKLEKHGLPGPIVKDDKITLSLSEIKTRLIRFDPERQERLVNWGYALADAAMRRHVLEPSAEAGKLPYPERPL